MNHAKRNIQICEMMASQYIPISHLNCSSIFETQSGDVGSVYSLQGIQNALQTEDTFLQHRDLMVQAALGLQPGCALTVVQHRSRDNRVLNGGFAKQKLANQCHSDYCQLLSERNYYSNNNYLVLLWRGQTKVTRALSHHRHKALMNTQREHHIAQLKSARAQMAEVLKPFIPRLLSKQQTRLGLISEPLSLFSLVVNGEYRKFRFP